jgi:hypothetical protein
VATFTLDPAVPRIEPTNPDRYRDDHFVFQNKPTSQTNSLHSMSVSDDGTRVYMANSQAGYFILDSTVLAQNAPCIPNTVTVDALTNTNPALCLRKINPDPNARYDHAAIREYITRFILCRAGRRPRESRSTRLLEESNRTITCPWTPGEILDITDEEPHVIARYMVPENLGENCFVGGPGDPVLFRSFPRKPLLFSICSFSRGIRPDSVPGTFRTPRCHSRSGFRTAGIERRRVLPRQQDVWMWPFPILHNGLIYVTDENSGLYVLKYRGPGADELPQQGTYLSNINVH